MCAVWLAVVARRAMAAPAPVPTIGLSIAVAQDGGRPVADDAWIDRQIAEANRLYATVPLRFRRVHLAPAPWLPTQVDTRAQRDRAAGAHQAGAIDLRVVGGLMDVDTPGVVRRGVHWRLRRDPSRHYIILSVISAPAVLAHELGHFFGNGHSQVPDNLMCYERTGGEIFLDGPQLARIRDTLRAMLRSGELTPD